ncbi:PH domain-containing protein [Saccharopolyspora erythraea]|uniref:PH domain-containing protein n=1 Tax=Saccharopolyspora erythraea TaxID=1836 RepID=UPI001BAC2167|nr:PH domain-containing protein [Saccharopolyspora erythraea]QUH00753.1 PH domain-containing protein [Saccharopolyspora erythraea]
MPPHTDMLVITRSAAEERRVQRSSLISIMCLLLSSALCATLTVGWLIGTIVGIPGLFAFLPLLASVLGLYVTWTEIRMRRLNRAMRNLQLALTSKGVAYRSCAGTFFAPWSAVREIRFRRHLGTAFVVVDALDWGGPAAEVGRLNRLGRVGRLALPLPGSGVDTGQVWRSVYYLSDGAVQVRS